jgi:deoxyribose-phosphate aldolase
MSETTAALRAMALLDLTDLAEDASEVGLRALCERAVSGPVPVAAICIWPRFVAPARALLGEQPIAIATVVNFPLGDIPVAPVLRETEGALAGGADEIDLVLPWRALLAGQAQSASDMVEIVKARCGDKTLKVILETGEYPDLASVRAASDLAIAAGADFIKTSTGKTARSANLEAARTMLEAIKAAPRPVGLKPSGGIRTLADAAGYLALADEIMGSDWATPKTFRFGASGLHQVLVDVVAGAAAEPASGPY